MNKLDLKKQIVEFQKLAKNIDKNFDPRLDRIINISSLRQVSPDISYDNAMALEPDSELWITLSRMYFNEPQYQRIIMYYATLFTNSYFLAPIDVDAKTVNTKRLDKEYREALELLDDSLNLENFTMNSMKDLLTEGAVFYYYDWVTKEGETYFNIIKLPRDYCTIVGKAKNDQLPLVRVDISFIGDVIANLNTIMNETDVLNQYPLELKQAYLNYKNGKSSPLSRGSDTNRYVILSPAHAVGFTTYNSLPPFAHSLRQIMRTRKFEEVRDEYIETTLQKILFQHVQINRDGDPEIDLALAAEFHSNLKKITRDIPRLNAFTSLADTKVLDLNDTRAQTDMDFIKQFDEQYYSDIGVSQQIFTGETAASLGVSADKDEAFVWGLMRQIEIWVNFLINLEIGSRPKRLYNFVVSYLPVSYRNREKMMNSYLKNAEYGYSKLLPQIAVGVKQRHFESLLYLENDLLNLNERLVPLRSSHTMSGTDANQAIVTAEATDIQQAEQATVDQQQETVPVEETASFTRKSSMRKKKDSTFKKEANQ